MRGRDREHVQRDNGFQEGWHVENEVGQSLSLTHNEKDVDIGLTLNGQYFYH
jgi:hypothetical protein